MILAVGQTLETFPLPRKIEIRDGRLLADGFGRTSRPGFLPPGISSAERLLWLMPSHAGRGAPLPLAAPLKEKMWSGSSGIIRSAMAPLFLPGRRFHRTLRKWSHYEEISTLFFPKSNRNSPRKLSPGDTKEELSGGCPGIDAFRDGERGFPMLQMRDVYRLRILHGLLSGSIHRQRRRDRGLRLR